MVVEEVMYGDTKVKFCDDYYVDKTPEEIQKIIDNVSRIIYQELTTRKNDDSVA